MNEYPADPAARREAVQPSLWDRLVDDLPGLNAEIDALRHEMAEALGGRAELDKLVEGGARAVERRSDLPPQVRKRLHMLIAKGVEQRRLEERGIVVSTAVLREAVRRDIEALFNVERLEARYLLTEAEERRTVAPADILADFPAVRKSVLNFGVPAFAGRTGTDFDKDALAKELREVLAVFEPRLKRETIRVGIQFGVEVGLRIDIDATLMTVPVPERLRLSTTIDLDTGSAATELKEA
jgi:type VI secretion system protein ImpF